MLRRQTAAFLIWQLDGRLPHMAQVKLLNQKEGFPATALREINVLLSLHHDNIVNVREMVVGSSMDKARSRRDRAEIAPRSCRGLIAAAHLISAIMSRRDLGDCISAVSRRSSWRWISWTTT